MRGRTPAGATRAFLAPLQLATSCLSRTVVQASGYQPTGDGPAHAITVNRDEPFRLKGVDFRLSFWLRYRIARPSAKGEWTVVVRAYGYEFVDGEGREFLAYHWHPDTPVEDGKRVVAAHLHLRQIRRLDKTHLPTGEVGIGSVIRLAIEMGAKPLRSDWELVLSELDSSLTR